MKNVIIVLYIVDTIISYNLFFQYFSFQFIEIIYSKVFKQSKGGLLNVFYGSSEDIGEDTFNFLSSLRNELIKSLLSNVIDIFCCGFNYSWCDFTYLINKVSPPVCEIISTKKTTKLSFLLYRAVHHFFVLFFSSLPAHSEILHFLVQLQENQEACFLLQQYNLQKICSIFLSTSDVYLQRLLLIRPR